MNASDSAKTRILDAIDARRSPLRDYQRPVIEALLSGVSPVVVTMSRQAGKNETAARAIAALLITSSLSNPGSIISAAPSLKVQGPVATKRLAQILDLLPLRYRARGYAVEVGHSQYLVASAHPQAAVVGLTASIALIADEAQDIDPPLWLRKFAPMAASTNAPTWLFGTEWTDQTLLATTRAHARELEKHDGRRRVFQIPWRTVAAEVPAYGAHVRAQIAELGPDHPAIRTQYELLPLAAGGRLLATGLEHLFYGNHPPETRHTQGPYVMAADIAGSATQHGRHDYTAAHVARVIPTATTTRLELVQSVHWRDMPAPDTANRLDALFNAFQPLACTIDATGIGQPIADQLQLRHPGRITPLQITPATKSALIWSLVAAIAGNRIRFYRHDPADEAQTATREQAEAATLAPGASLARAAWTVPGHDDLLTALAILAHTAPPSLPAHTSLIIENADPLDGDRRHEK